MNHCPLCEREGDDLILTKHHLKTKRKDKQDTEDLCRDCHSTIHRLFTNTELRDSRTGLDTIEGLLANARFAKAVAFIAKQHPSRRLKPHESNERKRKRGRRR